MDTTLAQPFGPLLRLAGGPEASAGAWWRADAPEAVFGDFACAHRRRVFGLLLGIVGSADDAEDLTQEVFLRAWRARAKFRPGAQEWPWLAAIAVNCARDRRRRLRHAEPLARDIEARTAHPAERSAQRQQLDRVCAALSQLPGRQREVILLHAFAGLTMAEAAAAMGIRQAAARMALHRARRALRAILGEEERR